MEETTIGYDCSARLSDTSREEETKYHPGGRRAGRCVVYAVPITDNLPYNITLGAC